MNSQMVKMQSYLSSLLLEKTYTSALYEFATQACALFHDLHKHDIVASSVENGNWYRFNGKLWVKEHSDTIIEYFIDMLNEIRQSLNLDSNPDSNPDSNHEEDCFEFFGNIIYGKEFNVLNYLIELFYDSQLLSKLNSNPNLVSFENGVYDFVANDFREHRYDDYLSLSTRTIYTHNLLSQIKELLTPNVYEVFYSVNTKNTDEIDFIRQQLGDYFIEMDSKYFTNTSGSFMDGFPRKLIGRKFVYVLPESVTSQSVTSQSVTSQSVTSQSVTSLNTSLIKMLCGHDALSTFIPDKGMVDVVFHGRLCFQNFSGPEDSGLLRRHRELPSFSLGVSA